MSPHGHMCVHMYACMNWTFREPWLQEKLLVPVAGSPAWSCSSPWAVCSPEPKKELGRELRHIEGLLPRSSLLRMAHLKQGQEFQDLPKVTQ